MTKSMLNYPHIDLQLKNYLPRHFFPQLLLIVLILISSQCLNAQEQDNLQLTFKELSIDEGLAQSTVYCAMQDSKGYIWLGTRTGGLDKYDGYNFEHHKYDQEDPYSISGNEIISLYEDKDGFIWVGTRNEGLNKYDPRTERFYRYYSDDDDGSLKSNTINSITQDIQGLLWFATNNGVFVYNDKDDSFIEVFNSMTNQAFRQINRLYSCDEQNIYIASKSSGLMILDSKSKTVTHSWSHNAAQPNSISDNNVTAIRKDDKGRLWCGTRSNGINLLSDIESGHFTHFKHDENNKNSLSSNIIRSLHIDEKGILWIGTKDGLNTLEINYNSFSDVRFSHYQNNTQSYNSLSNNSIYCFLADKQNNFWLGTWSGGVNHVITSAKNFNHVYQIPYSSNSLNNNSTSSFAQMGEMLYIGTEGGGLNCYNLNSGEYTFLTKEDNRGLTNNHIKSLLVENENLLWVGTFEGLHLYNIETNRFKSFLKGQSIYSLLKDNETLWVATSKKLFKLNNKGNIIKEYTTNANDNFSISDNSINTLCKDKDGKVWIGTKSGFNLYNAAEDNFKGYFRDKENNHSISHNHITSLKIDHSNNIWIGTFDGLNVFDINEESFTSFGEKDGLPDNVINNIQIDKSGQIWVTTNRGLCSFRYSKEENENKGLIDLKTFGKDDGLQGNEFLLNSSYQNNDGEIYLGGTNGYNVFNPNQIIQNSNPPEVLISRFNLFNKPVNYDDKNSPISKHISYYDEITLNHKQSVFSFGFTALNYISPEKNEFAYYMEEFDEDWNYSGSKREVSYTNLPSGDYIFRVKASNNDGVWNEEGIALKISILPPWWERIWFRITAILSIIISIFLFVRWRTNQARIKREELENKVSQATKDIEEKNEKLQLAQQQLGEIIGEVKNELGKTSEELLEATNSQASTIEEISSSIEQMTRDIDENAQSASKMFQSAKVVEENANTSVNIVSQTVKGIEEITEGIRFISEFARTTNLLSLNAQIEAARAGKEGRSFGVVANEVKKLADNSHEVANSIQTLSDNGLNLSKEANAKISELQRIISQIVELIALIKESSDNQNHEAKNVNTAIQQISVYINSTAQLAGKLDNAINSLDINALKK